MKKLKHGLLAMILLLSTAACATSTTSTKIKVATTAYAFKYFIERVGGDDVEVVYSLNSNPHHFELTQEDAKKIAEADIFLNVEAGDYKAIGDQLMKVNSKMKYMDLGADSKLVAGSDNHEDHEGSEDHSEHSDENSTTQNTTTTDHSNHTSGTNDNTDEHAMPKDELDPHMWLDPVFAKDAVFHIAHALREHNPNNASMYEKNGAELTGELTKLDKEFSETLGKAKTKDILVAHAAYTYITNRYGLEQKAVNNMSDHSENTQQAVIDLDAFVDEHQIKYMLVEPNFASNSTVDVLVANKKLTKLNLYNLETPIDEEMDYFVLMRKNLETLNKATQ